MQFNNFARAFHHYENSLKLSDKNNPFVFKEIVEPLVLLYIAQTEISMYERIDKSSTPYLFWAKFCREYWTAKERVGVIDIAPKNNTSLYQLSTAKPKYII